MLHDFLTEHRAEIITLCRAKVAARAVPRPTQAELQHGVPSSLDQLGEILRLEISSSPGIVESATRHGEELLRMGFTVGQVVHDYGDICQSVTELALERMAPITTAEFRTFKPMPRRRHRERRHRVRPAARTAACRRKARSGTGFFAHEIRNLLNTATLSFEALRRGSVGVGGSTAAVLDRSLSRLREFVDRSLAGVRLEAGIQNRERICVAEFVDEMEVAAATEARTRGLRLMVERADADVAVEVDRQILASIVVNLLQNAFKFTRPEGHVSLRSFADADRVLIEVEDECGGLPPGDPKSLFRPFEQRGNDRTGLGLGLAIIHRGVEASGGVLHVRDLAGTGCIFTVDLPRAAASAKADLAGLSRQEGACAQTRDTGPREGQGSGIAVPIEHSTF
jgi:signal transduction histidine kinase